MRYLSRELPGWGFVGTWSALTFVVSALICASVAVMHVKNEKALKQATDSINDLRQSRLDVHQGMVNIRMSAFLHSDDQRDRGEHLLTRAREQFLSSTKYATDRRSEFEDLFGAFRAKLDRSILPGSGREDLAELLVAFTRVQDLFADIERGNLRSLDALEIEQNRILGMFVGVSTFLLLGVGASAIWSARQRRAALAATHESEERFRRFFEMAPLPISYIGRTGDVLAVNRKFEATFGYSHEEIRTFEDWLRLAYPDAAYRGKIAALHDNRLKQVPNTEESASSEFQAKCRNGTVLDVVVTATPLDDGILKVFQDITHIRQAERAIRENEERFRRFFEMAPMPITYVDKVGKVLAVNRSFTELFGYTQIDFPTVAEFRQRVYPDPAYREKAIALHVGLYAEADATGASGSAQFSVTCRNGQVREFVVTVTPLADGYLNTFQDITEIRQAERATRDSEERFRRFFEMAPTPIVYVDRAGNVLAVNRKFGEMVGYTQDDFPTVAEFRRHIYPDPAYREKAIAQHVRLYAVADATKGSESALFSVTCRNGQVREIVVTVTALADGFLNTYQDITETRKVESALRESEARFRQLFDHSPLPKGFVDASGRLVAINRKFEQVFGYTLADIPTIDDWWQRAYPDPAYRAEVLQKWSRQTAQPEADRKTSADEFRITCKDGSERFMLISGAEIDGGMIAAFTDVTDRRLAERTIREEMERSNAARADAETARNTLAAALSAMPDPVAIVDTTGRFIHINEAFAQAQNYRNVSECPESLDKFAPTRELYTADGERVPVDQWPFSRALRGETGVGLEYRIRRLENSTDWYASVNMAPIRDASGAIVGGIMASRDVTQRHFADIALQEEMARSETARIDADNMRSRLEAALGAMSESVLIVDDAGDYVHFNDAFARYHRFANRAACPTSFAGFASYIETMDSDGLPIPKGRRPVMRALAGETGIEYELRHRRKDTGETWTGLCNFAPIRYRGGKIVGAVVTARDITERRAAEAQLAESQAQLVQSQKMEAVGQLTGGIAHDFNNLLAIIIGNLELLKAETSGAPSIEECADTALRASIRGAELTRRLLAFSRRQTLVPRRVELNALVLGLTSLLKRTLGETVRIETHLAPDVDGVNVDPGQLESALLNLAVNARDAMPGGGTLTITTRMAELDEEYARNNIDVVAGTYKAIAVTDTGNGMPPDVVRRAFEPFFTTKEVGKGTGLGLSMVYGFAKQSRGHVSIYSEPGRGTTVTIYLPCDAAPASASVREQPAADRPGKGEHLLVVEDNEDLRKLICSQLVALGYDVETASEGPAALARLADGPEPRLLLTDIAMPGGLDGTEVAAAARVRYPGIRILYMSGFAEGGSKHDRIEADGDGFLQKPFTKAQLSEAIERALHKQGDAA